MKSHHYGRLISVFVGVLTLAITVSALFSLAQQGPPSNVPAPPDVPPGPPPNVPAHPKVPHPACPTCFTYACPECYTIFEEVPGTGIIIAREIPSPAPLAPGEVREEFDPETGLPIWYIGHQGVVGPTDEEPVSPELSISVIELQRIQARHHGEIFSIPGVHAFGIGARGFVVYLDPEHLENESLIPKMLEGVPVEVELGGPFVTLSHWNNQYRPVPTSANVGRTIAPSETRAGTTGPHIVRAENEIGYCCRIHTLTAGHVLKHQNDPPPSPGAEPQVYQTPPGFPNSAQWGWFIRGFQQTPCDPNCASSSAPLNYPSVNPDVAVIAHISPTHDDPPRDPTYVPTGHEPIRKMYYGPSSSVSGPSGILQTAGVGTEIKWWGVRSDAPNGTVREIRLMVVVTEQDPVHGNRQYKWNALTMAKLERGAIFGDSGALVAKTGIGNRHVVGIGIAIDSLDQSIVGFHNASDIKTAFANANFPFSHFWGTAEGYRKPAVTQCDGSC